MKKLLILFFLFSLCLSTQASASECLNSHLAYQKQKVGKKAVKQTYQKHQAGKKIIKRKMKPQKDDWDSIILISIIAILSVGIIVGLIAWLIFKGAWWLWILGGILSIILIFMFLRF